MDDLVLVLLRYFQSFDFFRLGIQQFEKPDAMLPAVNEDVAIQIRNLGMSFRDFIHHVVHDVVASGRQFVVQVDADARKGSAKKHQRQ